MFSSIFTFTISFISVTSFLRFLLSQKVFNFRIELARQVDACNTCHGLALPLLVLGVLADDSHDAAATDHLALLTDLLDAGSDFHGG